MMFTARKQRIFSQHTVDPETRWTRGKLIALYKAFGFKVPYGDLP